MNYKDIVCNPNVVSPLLLVVFSDSSCLKPKVASVIVLVTFIVPSYARFMMTVDLVTVDFLRT